jgi:hypothetical protein
MKLRTILGGGGVVLCAAVLGAFQMPFREYPAQEYSNFPLPSDYKEPSEFVFARLMYPDGRGGRGFGFGRFGRRDWREGYTNWTNDYPRSDRHLMVAFRRLTRINARSVEQPVNLDDGDDVYNWPFLYAGRVIAWDFSDQQNAKLRDFIARGGFLVCDDIWGESEWDGFMENLVRLYPDRQVEELPDSDPAFHTVYDLDQRFRYQILGQWSRGSGRPLNGGVTPHWRGVYDEKKRLVVGIWVNNDTGDSWEWADDPTYPERYSALGFRIMINHVTYAMTH